MKNKNIDIKSNFAAVFPAQTRKCEQSKFSRRKVSSRKDSIHKEVSHQTAIRSCAEKIANWCFTLEKCFYSPRDLLWKKSSISLTCSNHKVEITSLSDSEAIPIIDPLIVFHALLIFICFILEKLDYETEGDNLFEVWSCLKLYNNHPSKYLEVGISDVRNITNGSIRFLSPSLLRKGEYVVHVLKSQGWIHISSQEHSRHSNRTSTNCFLCSIYWKTISKHNLSIEGKNHKTEDTHIFRSTTGIYIKSKFEPQVSSAHKLKCFVKWKLIDVDSRKRGTSGSDKKMYQWKIE